MNINVNSGDGNSIYEVAHRYRKMQLREIMKNPEEIRQKIKDGTDTGSLKFLEEFDRMSNMIYQLKTKTSFKVVDKSKIAEDKLNEIFSSMDKENYARYLQSKTNEKQLTEEFDYIVKLDNTKLQPITTDNQIAYFHVFKSRIENLKQARYLDKFYSDMDKYFKAFDKQIEKLIPSDSLSNDSYSKLAGISDSIPNLLGQVLSLSTKLQGELSKKYMDWEKEIEQSKMVKLLEQAKETQLTYTSLSNMQAVMDYKVIYNKIDKPLKELVSLIFRMSSDSGSVPATDARNFEELTKAIKITPAIQAKLKAEIVMEMNKRVIYRMHNPWHNNNQMKVKFISDSKTLLRDSYKPYVDDGDIIKKYIEQDLETAYPELQGKLGDVVMEIEKRTAEKNKLIGSGKTKKKRSSTQSDLNLFVNTFHMKRFL